MPPQMPADAARLASPRERGQEGWEKQDKVILGHVKCVPDHADHGQENEKNAVRGQEMPAWRGGRSRRHRGGGGDGICYCVHCRKRQSLTRPITSHARATKLAGWGLCRSAWASPAAAGHVLRAPEVAAAVGAHFLPVPIDQRGPTAVALARQSRVAFGLACWLPLPPASAPPSALHPGRGSDAKWETDRLTCPGSGWTHRDPAPGF